MLVIDLRFLPIVNKLLNLNLMLVKTHYLSTHS